MPFRPFHLLTVAALLIMLIFALPGCKYGKNQRYQDELKTSVTYTQRIVLPPKAILTVTLEDVSRMDAPSVELGKGTILAEGPPPFMVSVPYDASRLSDSARYAVRARITENNNLLFTSDTHIDPFTGPAGETVEIVVVPVER
ncbi:YbaY family lipoprotein [Pseudodesulfovibrio sp. zrk46]|uniref:YbaY family lipoprotein n=1 Tax=Pseudodesulfovibrio sp. zrk46 TaxID=2725288 RepID=UPI0014498CE7|nr:YbaY family lipoprotein [Pseudodesulfovibrio sp. zrk46]QJB55513.1 hypothetical protein HFN16_03490 [Pseudodesulfovibrio sp. zrk46]